MNLFSNIKAKIKNRLGELWWYTIVLFVAGQLGSVINAFIGLWLVPKYIPQSELGALLPLASVGGLMGLPLAIMMMPFLKFLTKYMAQGEAGKVKALLRDVFILAGITFLLVSGIAYLVMPLVFKRMRVENGLLSILVISSGIFAALAPVFSTALQALKKFKMISVLGFAGAVIRLVTLGIVLPFRGLSGYFVGQIAPLIFGSLASLWTLRQHLRSNVKMVSYWGEDWKPILKFTAWNALLTLAGQFMGATEGFVIRHRLPDVESAGYYMISRFAEISLYISMASSVVLFPLISESHEKKLNQEQQLLVQSCCYSFLAGLCFALVVTPVVSFLFEWKADWASYRPFTPHLFVVCLIHGIRGSTYSFFLYKIAKNEFDFVPLCVCVPVLEMVVLYGLTGYTFFAGWIPPSWVQMLTEFNPSRLSVILGIILLSNVLILLYVIIAIVKIRFRIGISSDTARISIG